MNFAMPPDIRSRIATAVAMGALATICALSAPAHAFAAPPKLAYQTNGTNIPASLDGLRYAQLPLPVDYRGGSDNDDDDDDDNAYIYY